MSTLPDWTWVLIGSLIGAGTLWRILKGPLFLTVPGALGVGFGLYCLVWIGGSWGQVSGAILLPIGAAALLGSYALGHS